MQTTPPSASQLHLGSSTLCCTTGYYSYLSMSIARSLFYCDVFMSIARLCLLCLPTPCRALPHEWQAGIWGQSICPVLYVDLSRCIDFRLHFYERSPPQKGCMTSNLRHLQVAWEYKDVLYFSTFYNERPLSSDESRPSSRSFCELKYRTQIRVNTARNTMASMPESIPRIFPVPSPVRTPAHICQ